MITVPEINLRQYHKSSQSLKIPNCFYYSYLVEDNAKNKYFAKYFYPSWIKDNCDDGLSPFHSEILAVDRLKDVCKSICKFCGYNKRGFDGNSVLLFEYVGTGKSLQDVLSKLDDTQKHKIIVGVALGMEYCHSKGVCHRNLKADNILINSNYEPVICNFEESKTFEQDAPDDGITETVRGTPIFMDPNIYENDDCGYKPKPADVYSFGFVMHSILSGKTYSLRKSFVDNFYPSTSGIDDMYGKLIQRCWSHDENSRPTFSEIIEALEEIKTNHDNINAEEIDDYIKSFSLNKYKKLDDDEKPSKKSDDDEDDDEDDEDEKPSKRTDDEKPSKKRDDDDDEKPSKKRDDDDNEKPSKKRDDDDEKPSKKKSEDKPPSESTPTAPKKKSKRRYIPKTSPA